MSLLFHLHIPKTGGTSLLRALELNKNVQRLPNTNGWRGFKLREGTECISGHVPYDSIDAGVELDYITVFRHPVDRAMSFYHYVMGRGVKNSWYSKIKDMTLDEFLVSNVLDNECVRMLSGTKDMNARMTPRDLERAIENLHTFKYVALLENINNDFDKLASLIGLHGQLPHMLKTKNPGRHSLRREVKTKAFSASYFDIQLYKEAQWLNKNGESIKDVASST